MVANLPNNRYLVLPGTLFARAIGDSVRMGPKDGRVLVFGRNRPEVHLCIGEDDLSISRRHGTLTCHGSQWWLRNTGVLGIHVGETRLVTPDDAPFPLTPGFTSLTIEGRNGRLHLIEVQVYGGDTSGGSGSPRYGDKTLPVRAWMLDDDERLVIVAMAQDYLRSAPDPRPRSWQQVASLLQDIDPARSWTEKK